MTEFSEMVEYRNCVYQSILLSSRHQSPETTQINAHLSYITLPQHSNHYTNITSTTTSVRFLLVMQPNTQKSIQLPLPLAATIILQRTNIFHRRSHPQCNQARREETRRNTQQQTTLAELHTTQAAHHAPHPLQRNLPSTRHLDRHHHHQTSNTIKLALYQHCCAV